MYYHYLQKRARRFFFYINSFVVVFMCLGKGNKDEINFNFSFKL